MARSFYLAPSLVALRNQINQAHPGRDKMSDGWIGDASHSARKSDHNPDWPAGGVVRAIDVDKDGINAYRLVATAIADFRTQYVIFDGWIWSRTHNFAKRAYTGPNKHTGHVHISIRHGGAYEGPTLPWAYNAAETPTSPDRQSNEVIAREVLAGKWGNGDDRKNRLKNAGYDPAAVQAEVNRMVDAPAQTPAPAPARKSVADLASEVIAGEWGSGDDRKRRLSAAGHDAAAVQAEVNRRFNVKVTPRGKSIATLASEVINGEWGTGPDRKRRLREAGYDAEAVQDEVNRRLR